MSEVTNISDLLTDNLDIWTSAIERRSTAVRGSRGGLTLYGVEKLRRLIFDLAVSGKLLPQEPKDEPASEVLRRLAKKKSKQNLTTAKSLELTEIDGPFQTPIGWIWTNLGSIFEDVHYGYTASADSNITDVKLLRITDIQDGKVNWDSVPGCVISADRVSKYKIADGDIMIARTGGTIGKTFLARAVDVTAVFASYLIRAKSLDASLSPYAQVYFGSDLYWRQLYANSAGTGQPNVNATALKGLSFPLPPLAEQHRIVAKVDELMGLCDRLEAGAYDAIAAHQLLVSELLATLTASKNAADFAQSWQRIEANFDTLFTTEDSIETLKQTILQLAVMGKLVPQDANDEPASELLKQVRQTRIEIASQQKVRKLKQHNSEKLSAKPFDLPRGWEWATFPELGIFDRGKSKHRPRNDPKLFTPGIHPLVQTGEVARADEYIREFHSEYSDVGLAQSRMWPKGTLCITIAANIADTAILDFDACFPDSVVGFMPFEPIVSPRYFLHFMKTAKADLLKYAPSTAQKNINVGILDSVQIPIPPLNEMIRIVQKVDSLISLCGELKAQLSKAQNQQTQFADAIASRAVA